MIKPTVWMPWTWPAEALAPLEAVAEIIQQGALDTLPGAAALFLGGSDQIDGAFMDKVGPNLKVLARPGIGVDCIDLAAATARGILVVNTPDAPSESTAEHAIALLLALSKRVVMGDMHTRGAAIPRTDLLGTEVRQRVLGVVGYGRIGRRVAEIAALGLRMRVWVYDPFLAETSSPVNSIEMTATLDNLLTEADFITLHTPLLPQTRHLIGERELRLLKPGSYLINTSRGPVVDEAALIRALTDGHLAGAGLDVLDPEPPRPDNPLLRLPNVILTPHIASHTDRGMAAMMDGAIEQVLYVLKGQRPPFLVNSAAWPGRVG